MNYEERKTYVSKWRNHNIGGPVLNTIPDGIVCYRRIETYKVFCSNGSDGLRRGLICCADWEFSINLGEPNKTIGDLEDMLHEDGWKKVDGLWRCSDCNQIKTSLKKKR